MRDGIGLPMLIVLATVTAWYVGDAFYNDYAGHHAIIFKPEILSNAWWQVASFVAVFWAAIPYLHRWYNKRFLGQQSGLMQMLKHGVAQPVFQTQLNQLFYGCVSIWAILSTIAVIVLQGEVIHYFLPFLSYQTSPWSHGRVGGGFDCFSVLGVYLDLLNASIFGVVAALSTNRRIRMLAMIFCLLTWPNFIFSRTRNTLLAVVIPGILSWAFLRLRGGMLKKITVLGGCFLLINAWMGFIIANRSHANILSTFHEKGFDVSSNGKVHHEGLNMYEELCWINTFFEQGTFQPDWGGRYLAELVNPIPRGLWKGKPLIGIDYAIARGQGGAAAGDGGVYATISTGMIGQGAVNFGRFLGPAFAALLMSFWVVVLARLDFQIQQLGRLPLYAMGIILTFNLGRDITLITLYPFVFGSALIWWWERRRSRQSSPSPESGTQPAAATESNTRKNFIPTMVQRPRLEFSAANSRKFFKQSTALKRTSNTFRK